MTSQLISNGIVAGCIYALVALGFTVIYSTVRFFHFAHGAVYTTGAYLAWLATTQMGTPLLPSICLACLLAGMLGVMIDIFVYRPLRGRKSPNLVLLLASFGVFIFLQNSLQLAFGTDVKSIRVSAAEEGHHFLGAVITDTQIAIIAACLVLASFLVLFIKVSRLGMAIRAVADDPLAASVVGIHSDRIIQIAFFLGSALAGAAGILVSLETNIEPMMGMNAILKGIIAAVIGGMGSIPGALVGGILIGLAENLGIWWIPSGWKDAIAFAVLVAFLILRPNGIFAQKSEIRRL